jgi:hypothetical protein
MEASTKLQSRNRVLIIAYVILIIILTALAIFGSVLIHRSEYVAGTRNDAYYSIVYGFGLSVVQFFIMALVAMSTSILALISLVRKHQNINRILLKVMLMILGPIICYCAFEYTAPLAPIFLEGFEQWVLQNTDIDTIQTWLDSEGAKHAGKQYDATKGFPKELPEFLVKLNPVFISFSDSVSKNGLSVELSWFLAMDEYGLIVGPPTMETPEKGHIKLTKDCYEFRHPIKRGAYVFSRG